MLCKNFCPLTISERDSAPHDQATIINNIPSPRTHSSIDVIRNVNCDFATTLSFHIHVYGSIFSPAFLSIAERNCEARNIGQLENFTARDILYRLQKKNRNQLIPIKKFEVFSV